jgi:hypothetical protein
MSDELLINLIKNSPALPEQKKQQLLNQIDELTTTQKMDLLKIFSAEQAGIGRVESDYRQNLQSLNQKYQAFSLDFEKKEIPKAMAQRDESVHQEELTKAEEILNKINET